MDLVVNFFGLLYVVDMEGVYVIVVRNFDSVVSSYGDDVGEVIFILNVVVRKFGDVFV